MVAPNQSPQEKTEEGGGDKTAPCAEDILSSGRENRGVAPLLNAVSHELRTPLHGIIGFADILCRNKEMNADDRAKIIVRIKNNAVELLHKIESMTDITSVLSGKVRVNRSPLNIEELAWGVRDELLALKEGEGEISLEFSDSLRPLAVDGILLRKMLMELCGNGLKFAASQTGVMVRFSLCADHLIVDVTNHGEPIPPEEVESIFNLFMQCDDRLSRRHEGMGLGLAMVKSLAEAQGGSVGVTSGEESGTTFTLTLPVRLLTKE